METSANFPKLQMKLLVDLRTHRVVYGEIGIDVLGFLRDLLDLPLVLLADDSSLGVLSTSLQSITGNNLTSTSKLLRLKNPNSPKYFRCRQLIHDDTLCPSSEVTEVVGTPCPSCSSPMDLEMEFLGATTMTKNRMCFGCPRNLIQHAKYYLSDARKTLCPSCSAPMDLEMELVDGNNEEKPRSNEGALRSTYIVTDDLAVVPMSTVSAITLLGKLNVKDVTSLFEQTINLGMEEGIELLKASMRSKTVLTDVFLRKTKRSKDFDDN